MSCDCHAFASVLCCLVANCCERADLLALVCDVYCGFVTFPYVILGQEVWYLIVSIPDLCCLSYSSYPLSTQQSLIRLGGYPGKCHATLLVLS